MRQQNPAHRPVHPVVNDQSSGQRGREYPNFTAERALSLLNESLHAVIVLGHPKTRKCLVELVHQIGYMSSCLGLQTCIVWGSS